MEPIARPSGFDARIWYDSDEQEIHVRTEDGSAVLPSGKRRRYHGEERVVEAYPGERVRLCICDPALATGDFEHDKYSDEELVVEQDDGTPVGVYPGGLIVLRVSDIPKRTEPLAQSEESKVKETANETVGDKTDRLVNTRHFHSLLRTIFALADMNHLPEIHAAKRVTEQLEHLGASSPQIQAVREVMILAYAFAREEMLLAPKKQ